MWHESYENFYFRGWFSIGSRELIDAIFETLGFSDEIEVAAIAFDEAAILDFRVSVVIVVT